ncbi:hypothetical protein AVEN_110641-1 [Araneus ventricosus]|uniref:Uncharacterized protein n=1 Tax=Araneus ventricosus TaxID=182803 RepID=A0A4Y2AUC1_ARAVE|nr:hypothetical protein AVEN_110641-1 [Araneus ventricosus]
MRLFFFPSSYFASKSDVNALMFCLHAAPKTDTWDIYIPLPPPGLYPSDRWPRWPGDLMSWLQRRRVTVPNPVPVRIRPVYGAGAHCVWRHESNFLSLG